MLPKTYFFDYLDMPNYHLLVVTTLKGLAFVGSNGKGIAEFHTFYPNKLLVEDKKIVAPYITQLKEYLNNKRKHFDLPLDLKNFGTEFQRRVWRQILKIPYGATMSYGDIAASIDGVASAISVGHAVALNPALIVIPCHRVLLKNGKVGAYRGGPEMKKQLLKLEQEKR